MSLRTSRWILRIMVLCFLGPTLIGLVAAGLSLVTGDDISHLIPSLIGVLLILSPIAILLWKNRRPPRRRARTARRRTR